MTAGNEGHARRGAVQGENTGTAWHSAGKVHHSRLAADINKTPHAHILFCTREIVYWFGELT
jgi:hypothetical protein